MRWIGLVALWPLAALTAQASVRPWPVSSRPVTEIGSATGDSDLEIDGVSSAVALPDGRIVIANGDPLELRWYDRTGHLQRRIGRSGEGPGEFSRAVRVYRWRGDSVLTYTAGTKRLGLFSLSGHLVREWDNPAHNAPDDLLIYRLAFSRRGAGVPAACVRALIDRIPAASEPGRQVVPDQANRFWVRDPGASDWIVYTLAGHAIGRVRLAPTAELLDVGSDAVVVKPRDADDIEHLEVWHVTMPRPLPPSPDRCRQVSDSSVHPAWGLTSAMLRTDLLNMRYAGDEYFKKHHSYPHTFAEFGMTLSRPSDTELQLLRSASDGWSAIVTDKSSGMYCLDFVGTRVPGWPSGTPACAAKESAKN